MFSVTTLFTSSSTIPMGCGLYTVMAFLQQQKHLVIMIRTPKLRYQVYCVSKIRFRITFGMRKFM